MNGHRLTLDIERVLGLRARQEVRAEFRYDPAHPLLVSVEFTAEGGPRVRWRIGRDLLHRGLHEPSGLGDVRLRPADAAAPAARPDPATDRAGAGGRPTAWLRLVSADTAALFELPVLPLAAWLERTYTLVPAGAELDGLDWDATTAALLRPLGARAD
ncbi:SsgA family sporulation/cell division regulator [Kitasatospora sp. NPDC056327]|uniref:SsgA family sporulation/cell division regulator n=1 Tax=Kitasatospora sp. NPDC056327 TaxID=3345785 RepID=UPI0035DA7BCF